MAKFNFNEFLNTHYKSQLAPVDAAAKYNYIDDQKTKVEQYISRIAETNDNDLIDNLHDNNVAQDQHSNHENNDLLINARADDASIDESNANNENMAAEFDNYFNAKGTGEQMATDPLYSNSSDIASDSTNQDVDYSGFSLSSDHIVNTAATQDFYNLQNHEDLALSDTSEILNYEFSGREGALEVKGGEGDDALNIDMSSAKSAWIMTIELDNHTTIEVTDGGITSITGDNFISANDSLNFIELSDQSGTIQISDHSGATEVIDFSNIDNIFWS